MQQYSGPPSSAVARTLWRDRPRPYSPGAGAREIGECRMENAELRTGWHRGFTDCVKTRPRSGLAKNRPPQILYGAFSLAPRALAPTFSHLDISFREFSHSVF